MDLSIKSEENVKYMLNQIVEKLKIINMDVMKSSTIQEEQYEDLVDIYHLVMKREHFSPSEMQAIAEELGNLRKR